MIARGNASAILRLADDYQRDVVIPHCPSCTRPCCKLTDVVLDLSWQQTQALYQIGGSRRGFDREIKRGLHPHIRVQDGRYFAHGAPCPAYSTERGCKVYGTALKPEGCSDFPVYADGDALTVDLRCEAVRLDDVRARLAEAHPGARIEKTIEAEVLVSFEVRAPSSRGGA